MWSFTPETDTSWAYRHRLECCKCGTVTMLGDSETSSPPPTSMFSCLASRLLGSAGVTDTPFLLITLRQERALGNVCVCGPGKTGGGGTLGGGARAQRRVKPCESDVTEVTLINTRAPQGNHSFGKKYTTF